MSTKQPSTSAVEIHLPSALPEGPELASLLDAVRAADTALIDDDHEAAAAAMAPELALNSPRNTIGDANLVRLALKHNMISYERYVRRVEHLSRRPTGEYLLMGEEVVYPKAINTSYQRPSRRRFTDIWRKDGDRWLLSVRQATDIGEA